MFNKQLPKGDYVVSVSKEGYDTKFFLVKKRRSIEFNPKEVRISVNRKEAKKRRKIQRQKEARKRLKRLKKERREKEKPVVEKNTGVVKYNTTRKADSELTASEIQTKYAEILGVDVFKLTNKKLYEFIDRWMGTPYLWGGETEDAIDCSSFTQRLFIESYNIYLERTAQKQSESKYTELFTDLKYLKEVSHPPFF